MLGRGPIAFAPLATLNVYQSAGGIFAATLGPLAISTSGGVLVRGTLGTTLGALTCLGTGSIPHTASLAATLGPLALNAQADLVAKGTLAAALDPLTMASHTDTPAQGVLATTLGALTLAAIGGNIITGVLGSNPQEMNQWVPLASQVPLADPKYVLDPLVLAGAGTVRNQVFQGPFAATLGSLTLAAQADLIATGTLAATLGPVVLAASGKVPAGATLAATLGPLSLVAQADLIAGGVLAATLGPLALAATATSPRTGSLAATLGQLTLAATGTVVNQVYSGTLDATLGPVVLAGQAKAIITGWLASPVIGYWVPLATAVPLAGPYELQPLSLAAAGVVRDQSFAGLIATLAPLTLAATGKATVRGTLGTTLASISGTLTGKVRVTGSSGGQLFPLMLVATGTVRNQVFAGSLVSTLGPLALAATGTITAPIRIGVLTATLGPLTLRGLGRLIAGTLTWPHQWCPMPGPTRQTTVAVDTVQFGDGYTWRSTHGLNPCLTELKYSFPFVGMDALVQMDSFLTHYGTHGFNFVPPDSSAAIQVCCDEWTATIIDRGKAGVIGTLTATFQQAYNVQPVQHLAA